MVGDKHILRALEKRLNYRGVVRRAQDFREHILL